MSWKEVCVGDVISTKKGFAFKSIKYVSKGVPIVRVSDFTMDSISDADLKFYPQEEREQYKEFELREKDIIVQTVGSWQNNPASVVGKVVHVPGFIDGALLNQNAVKIIPNEGIDREYFFYRLRTDEFKGHVLGEARGAANQASITLETIKSFRFFLPDYDTQIKIGQILSVYDHLIENNQKQIKLLEEAAQRFYKEWFVDLRFPNYEHCQIVDGIPKGWRKCKVTDFLEVKYGKDHQALEGGDIPVYGSGGVMRKVKTILYSGESVLIPRKGSLNNIMYVTGNFWTIDTMFFSKPRMENIAKYTYLFLKRLDMYSFNIGAAVPSMTVKILDGIDILQPDKETLSRFEEIINPIFIMTKVLESQIEKMQQARNRLLPKLMNGEIEV